MWNPSFTHVRVLTVGLAFLMAVAGTAHAQRVLNDPAPELAGVDIAEHLGRKLPLDAEFRDESGKTIRFGDVFDGTRPRVLIFAYHTCPTLCSLVLDAAVRGLSGIEWTVGKQFDVVVVSIDPRDTIEASLSKRNSLVAKYNRGIDGRDSATGWRFLLGDEVNIRRLADAVGFQYRYDEEQKQYAHPAAIYLTTPTGELARYLYGISFEPNDLRLGLLEASAGRTTTTVEKLILYCYHYDPKGKHYAIVAVNVMRVGGVITMLLLGGLLAVLWLRDKRRGNIRPEPPASLSAPIELIAARSESTQASMP